ncbi:uncharacterized protein LOC131634304 [Vicia villosa]|uniref:uncharacterized protein LOC131634304 n=1 Tax=Vicia villosa TaxID=3911 RepID=UPI00273A8D9C|nr:uncharacterized protein LOC131634304 [Vicia villosa]
MYSNPPMDYPYLTPSSHQWSIPPTYPTNPSFITPTTPSFPSFPWELFSPYYTNPYVPTPSPSLYPNHGYSPHPPNPNSYSSYSSSPHSYYYNNYHQQLQPTNTSSKIFNQYQTHFKNIRDSDRYLQVTHPTFKKNSKKNIYPCFAKKKLSTFSLIQRSRTTKPSSFFTFKLQTIHGDQTLSTFARNSPFQPSQNPNFQPPSRPNRWNNQNQWNPHNGHPNPNPSQSKSFVFAEPENLQTSEATLHTTLTPLALAANESLNSNNHEQYSIFRNEISLDVAGVSLLPGSKVSSTRNSGFLSIGCFPLYTEDVSEDESEDENEGIDVVLNDESQREIPVIVCFEYKQDFIGSVGAASTRMNPKNSISQIKRLIGKHFSDVDLHCNLNSLPYNVTAGPNRCPLIKVRAGVEMVLIDAVASSLRVPLWRFIGGASNTITTDITIPIVSSAEAAELASKYYKQGFKTLKLKVGKNLNADIKVLQAIRSNIAREKYGVIVAADERNTVIDKNELLVIHIPSYLSSIRKSVATVMVSYSSWNDYEGNDRITIPHRVNSTDLLQAGVFATIDRDSLRKILLIGEFEEYPDENRRHCNAQLVIMLNSFANELLFDWCGKSKSVEDCLAAVDGLCDLITETIGDTDPVKKYHMNISVFFTSIPDFWSRDHLFPIFPNHCLDGKPTARGILYDLTCDSDGNIDKFIGGKSSLPLQELTGLGRGYYLGMLLGRACEEELGGLHNLFGGPSVVKLLQSDIPHRFAVTRAVVGPYYADVVRVMHHEPQLMFDVADKWMLKEGLPISFREQVVQFIRQNSGQKDIRNDNTVTWLCYWSGPINPKLFKYVLLAASSSLKGHFLVAYFVGYRNMGWNSVVSVVAYVYTNRVFLFRLWDPGKIFTTLRTRLFLKGLVMIEKRNYLDK